MNLNPPDICFAKPSEKKRGRFAVNNFLKTLCVRKKKQQKTWKSRRNESNVVFFTPPTLWKRGRWDLKASFPKASARWFITALCQKSFPQHETNNDTVIARTGELLIERYQLYVQPEEAKRKRGWREGAPLTDENQNLNPSTWVSREGVLCNESFQI